jgi:hypothetical protein
MNLNVFNKTGKYFPFFLRCVGNFCREICLQNIFEFDGFTQYTQVVSDIKE